MQVIRFNENLKPTYVIKLASSITHFLEFNIQEVLINDTKNNEKKLTQLSDTDTSER